MKKAPRVRGFFWWGVTHRARPSSAFGTFSPPRGEKGKATQANGSCRTMVWSRSGPVLTMASGQPDSSSSARR